MNHILKDLSREPGVTNAEVNTYMTDMGKRKWIQRTACRSNLMEDEHDFCLSLEPNDTAIKWATAHFQIGFMQNTECSGQALLGFLSPEKLKKYNVNWCVLHRTRRTWAAASSEGFLLKRVAAILLLCLFLPLEGKINAWYVVVGTPEARGSEKKALWFLTSFISAWQKGGNGLVVWPEGICFENGSAVKLPGSRKEVFQAGDPSSCRGGWEWSCCGQISLSALGAEVSCFKPRRPRMLVLAEILLSAGRAEMKGELKEKPTGSHWGKTLARNIFLSLSGQRLLTTSVHISSSKGSSEKATDEGKKHVKFNMRHVKKLPDE